MPVELTPADLGRSGAARTAARELLRSALDVLLVVLGCVAAAALAGVVWESVWHASPGVAFDHKWYLQPEAYADDFRGTGLYVLIAFGFGLAVSVLAAFARERNELATLFGVLLGSALAAWVMYAVGHRLGPPDPRILAQAAADYDPLPSDLRVQGGHHVVAWLEWIPGWRGRLPGAPFLAWPIGAVVGLSAVYFLFPGRGSHTPAPRLAEMSVLGR